MSSDVITGPDEQMRVLYIVMPQFGSEPRFEPEPAEPNSKFSSKFRDLSEPNLKSGSRFSQYYGGSNLN